MDSFVESLGIDGLYFKLTLGFALVSYLFETYLDWRQHKKYAEKQMPKELKGIVPDEKFQKAQIYGYDKSSVGFFSDGYSFIFNLICLFYLNVALWNWSGEVGASWAASSGWAWFGSDAAQANINMIVFTIISKIVQLPFSLYSTFVVEEKHGFNKQTVGLFFIDIVKELVVSTILIVPILTLLLGVIEWGGRFFYVYGWIFLVVVMVIMMTIYPNFIAPLFNKFTPVEEGELRTAIEQLAAQEKFPLTKLFVVDGSSRSAHSNAYFYGFFKNKRIVLYDTLIKQLDTKGIVAVLAHELGHWALNHTIKRMVVILTQMFVFLFLFGQMMNSERMYSDFGYNKRSTFIGLMCFSTIYQPVAHLLSLVLNAWSRQMEFEADAYAVKRGYKNIASALKIIAVENLGNMNPDPLYSVYHFSHPPLLERLRAIEAESKKAK